MRLVTALLCVGVGLGTASAFADTSATPEARNYIEHYGQGFPFEHEQEIIALYTRILGQTKHDNRDLQIKRALRYGPDERNRLDVHYSRSSGSPRPVVVFFHGGGFFSGDTQVSTEIYDNVANYLARNGVVGINATYRLTPQAHWPSGVDDVASALAWARVHVAEYGGDASRIFLMGHSAGAAHVAGYVFSDQLKAGTPSIAGAILLSGIYTVPDKSRSDAYYGTDASERFKQSPLNFVDGAAKVPVLVMFAEYDPLPMQLSAVELIQKLCARDQKCPAIEEVLGHNHMSEIFHFDTADDSGARAIVDFVQGARTH